MTTTLRYTLFGIGKLPADLRTAVESEGMIHLYDGVPVRFRFTGHVPGLLVSGTNTRTYSGALALTQRRILGTLSVVPTRAGKALDRLWDEADAGSMRVNIDETGVHMNLDVSTIDPSWNGQLGFHFDLAFSAEELAALPKRALSFDVPREFVLKAVGVPS